MKNKFGNKLLNQILTIHVENLELQRLYCILINYAVLN